MTKSFPVYVLVAVALVKDIRAKIAELLAPYAKALRVAEHEGPCPCVHAQVEGQAREMAIAGVQASDQPGASPFERVTATARSLQEAQRVAIQELLDKAQPNPKCKECGGSGTIKTTANPNGKWTRWEIGGTSSGNTLAGFLIDVVDDPNIVPVKQINLEDAPVPWAIVTPDGKWHAAGEPDWFGSSRIDDRDWEKTARKILEQHLDATLVVVECQS